MFSIKISNGGTLPTNGSVHVVVLGDLFGTLTSKEIAAPGRKARARLKTLASFPLNKQELFQVWCGLKDKTFFVKKC